MSAADPVTPDTRFSIRLPRPLWIGLTAAILAVVAVGVRIGMPIYWQQQAIREIERLKGTAVTAERRPAWIRNLFGSRFTDLFEDVVRVELSNSKIKDAELVANLGALRNIENLELNNTKIGNAGLASLRGMKKLQNLGLGGTKITDTGLDELGSLTSLKRIGLEFTKVTDNGLLALTTLPELSAVDLSNTQITDAGIAHFKRVSNLDQLILVGALVTDSGVDDLRRKFPKLIVLR